MPGNRGAVGRRRPSATALERQPAVRRRRVGLGLRKHLGCQAVCIQLCARSNHARVRRRGGGRDVADIRAVRAAGAAGVVLGRSLLEGRLDLGEALAC